MLCGKTRFPLRTFIAYGGFGPYFLLIFLERYLYLHYGTNKIICRKKKLTVKNQSGRRGCSPSYLPRDSLVNNPWFSLQTLPNHRHACEHAQPLFKTSRKWNCTSHAICGLPFLLNSIFRTPLCVRTRINLPYSCCGGMFSHKDTGSVTCLIRTSSKVAGGSQTHTQPTSKQPGVEGHRAGVGCLSANCQPRKAWNLGYLFIAKHKMI